jgi:hypothetical protein
MADKKKHHFVPYSYLRRFSHNDKDIFAKFNNEVKDVPLRQQNQKDYLYSLGRKSFGQKHNIIEDFFGEKVEAPFNLDMSKTIDKNEIPKNENLVHIVNFAIIQSCRPLIYKDEIEESLKQFGINTTDNFLTSYGFIVLSMINNFWEKIKTCSVEILIAEEKDHFITSDNPSTLWVSTDTDSIFIPMTFRFLHEDNPDLELIMPLIPKFLLKVHLNKPRQISQIIWSPNDKIVSESEVKLINSKIESSKHKCLYSVDKKIL